MTEELQGQIASARAAGLDIDTTPRTVGTACHWCGSNRVAAIYSGVTGRIYQHSATCGQCGTVYVLSFHVLDQYEVAA